VVHGARTPILAPRCDADVHDGSYGDRPKRTAPPAGDRVAAARVRHQTRVLDGALAASFDRGRHAVRRVTGARRVHDRDVVPVWPRRRHAAGPRGVPPGGVRSPRRRHSDRPAVEAMRERAQAGTAHGTHTSVAYARDAADRVLLVHQDRRQDGLVEASHRRRRDARAALDGPRNEAKSRSVDRRRGARGGGGGVDSRRRRSRRGRGRPP
jgi:hypothetical protein